jgi:cellulose synthase/poly-beta-1,6-N-acetylglucosamine synthase-like glycosyltransferase
MQDPTAYHRAAKPKTKTTVTVIVPAYNEEDGIRDTLDALKKQTQPPDRVIVVDDCSTDNMPAVLKLEYDDFADVLRPPANLGSKARAQNYALQFCTTDLVLPVDADTVLAPNYIELIVKPFKDPNVVIAAGNVQTKVTRTPTERGRSIEYLVGFHWERPIQNAANSPTVCSGCCSAFRRQDLVDFGGFPERTIVEDMDYTWSQQIAGRKAVYVAGATAWAADPVTIRYLRKQVWRWASGAAQNIRIHFRELLRHKPMLAFWVILRLIDASVLTPLWWLTPFFLIFMFDDSFPHAMLIWLGLDMLTMAPILLYASARRRLNPLRVLGNIPFAYLNKTINTWYVWKALIVELILVPLGKSEGLVIYEKGR